MFEDSMSSEIVVGKLNAVQGLYAYIQCTSSYTNLRNRNNVHLVKRYKEYKEVLLLHSFSEKKKSTTDATISYDKLQTWKYFH